jgi:hypothetical protein
MRYNSSSPLQPREVNKIVILLLLGKLLLMKVWQKPWAKEGVVEKIARKKQKGSVSLLQCNAMQSIARSKEDGAIIVTKSKTPGVIQRK